MEDEKPRKVAGLLEAKRPVKLPGRLAAWIRRQTKKMGSMLRRRKKLAAVALALVFGLGWAGYVVFFNDNEIGTRGPSTAIAAEFAARLPELEQAVKNNPNDATARKNYAVALYATRDFDNARKQYEEVVKLSPNDATAHNNLGNTWRDLKDFSKAVEVYRRAIELNPVSLNTYINLANVQLYNLGKTEDAIATYKQGLQKLPGNVQLELLLGMAYEQAHNFTEATQSYQNILARDSGNQAAQASLDRIRQR